jgi:hypothetical protein
VRFKSRSSVRSHLHNTEDHDLADYTLRRSPDNSSKRTAHCTVPVHSWLQQLVVIHFIKKCLAFMKHE